MKTSTNRIRRCVLATLSLIVGSALSASAAPVRGTPFFAPATLIGTDANGYPVYFLDDFKTFTYAATSDQYVYKYAFGWLYYFGGTTSDTSDAYFYDFTASDYLYTSADLYPYFYSFGLNTYLYYFEGSAPRTFYDFSSQSNFAY